MKKIIFSFVIAMMTVFSVNAQTAIETPKFFDNVYIGIEGGVSTPLTFDDLFPVNPMATLRVGKQFTPVWGAEVEGTAWFGSHASCVFGDRVNYNYNADGDKYYNTFRGMYVGVNGTMNLTNLFKGYTGTPRAFEVSAVAGTGWIHGFIPNFSDRYNNWLGAKTGLDFNFNFGKSKASTISVRPAVLWNLSEPGNSVGTLAFNRKGAELYLGLGYVYHFKTSNGTRQFKLYDVGAMNDEINRLRADLAKKPTEVIKEVQVPVRSVVSVEKTYVIQFAKNSSLLTDENMRILDRIPEGTEVSVVGSASIEGSKAHNDELSEARAQAVTAYLKDRKVNVVSSEGIGSSNGPTSNRLVLVTAK